MLNLRSTKNDLLAIRLYKADESPFSIIYQSGSAQFVWFVSNILSLWGDLENLK